MMRTQGYAAVTSRTLASAAGVKPALVHYYFRTMDDLFIALRRERAAKTTERYQRALTSAKPLRELWKLNCDPLYVASGFEFMALANHRKAVRAEIARYTKHILALQTALIIQALESRETVNCCALRP
jgi:AcrR family transcriptional regulator